MCWLRETQCCAKLRWQLVAHQHLAALRDKLQECVDSRIGDVRIMRQNGDATIAQRTVDDGLVLNGVTAQTKFGQHLPDIFGGLQGRPQFALRTSRRNDHRHIMLYRSQGTKP